MHKNSYEKMKWFKNNYLDISRKLEILDVGSLDVHENYNYSNIFNEPNWNYYGLDIKNGKNVDIVVKDIYNWFEIEDNSYDVVVSGQFFEHLEYFWLTMVQIERVLKPGGHVCIVAPSSGPKHGESIGNCYLFYDDGLRALAKYVDLNIIHASVDLREEAKPWHDACLIANKKGSFHTDENSLLENRINDLEIKLDSILDTLNNK